MRDLLPKSAWGDGPWQEEPDRAEWEHAGFPCLAVRPMHHGVWCGYVAVPPGHPLHGKGYDTPDVDVHGGLTYANRCSGPICHVAKPGEPEDVWWFGFDCGHAGDYQPGRAATLKHIGAPLSDQERAYDHATAVTTHASDWTVDVYRTLDYVRAETNRLAEQLHRQSERTKSCPEAR